MYDKGQISSLFTFEKKSTGQKGLIVNKCRKPEGVGSAPRHKPARCRRYENLKAASKFATD
jgi:hypothetical protein